MRLSIDERDHAYRGMHHTTKFRVFLDNVELFDCITADTEKGFVIRKVLNKHPVTRQLVAGRTGLIKGVVKIVPKNQPTMVVFDELTDLKPVAAPAEQHPSEPPAKHEN